MVELSRLTQTLSEQFSLNLALNTTTAAAVAQVSVRQATAAEAAANERTSNVPHDRHGPAA